MVLVRSRERRPGEPQGPSSAPPRLFRVLSALYLTSALLVVAWGVSRLLREPYSHWFSRADSWPQPVEGGLLLTVFFAPLFAYTVSLGLLVRRADVTGCDASSPLLLLVALVVHPVATLLVCAAYAHLSVFAPKGATWASVERLSQSVLLCTAFFGPLPALVQVAHLRRMKAYLLVCLLGSGWVLFLTWLLRDHYLDLIPGGSTLGW